MFYNFFDKFLQKNKEMPENVLILIKNITAVYKTASQFMNSLGVEVSKGFLEATEDYDGDTKVSAISIKGALKGVEVVPEEMAKKKINLRILSEEDIPFLQSWQLIQDLVGNKKIIDQSDPELVR
jgi:hypothetical protein